MVYDLNFHEIFVFVIKVLEPHQLYVVNLRLKPLKTLVELPIQSLLAVLANHLEVVFRHSFEELKVLLCKLASQPELVFHLGRHEFIPNYQILFKRLIPYFYQLVVCVQE